MKVYIITSGEYSDYCIDAVTLDKEEAEKMVNVFPEERIEEYDTDDFPKILINDPCWNCEYNLPTRNIIDGKIIHNESIEIYRENYWYVSTLKEINKVINKTKIDGSPYGFQIYIQAKDKEHAEKIFYDKIAEWKAEQKGII